MLTSIADVSPSGGHWEFQPVDRVHQRNLNFPLISLGRDYGYLKKLNKSQSVSRAIIISSSLEPVQETRSG